MMTYDPLNSKNIRNVIDLAENYNFSNEIKVISAGNQG